MIRIQDKLSSRYEIQKGVLQGKVLSVPLFLISINITKMFIASSQIIKVYSSNQLTPTEPTGYYKKHSMSAPIEPH